MSSQRIEGRKSLDQYRFVEAVKKAPWVELSVIAGSVALVVLGFLAPHLGLLHHIGSVGTHVIEYGALGSGTLLFIAYAHVKAYLSLRKAAAHIKSNQIVEKEKIAEPFTMKIQGTTVSITGLTEGQQKWITDPKRGLAKNQESIKVALNVLARKESLTQDFTVQIGGEDPFTLSYQNGNAEQV